MIKRLQGYADVSDKKNMRFTFDVIAGEWWSTFYRLLNRGYKFRALWSVSADGEIKRIEKPLIEKMINMWLNMDQETKDTYLRTDFER